tara:strand:+ start:1769 stop:1984 length:216 start_codon:yes stop_codon:yes gene_type:complete
MLGEIALGGGLLTVVSVSPFVVTVELDVLFVIMGSAAYATDAEMYINMANKNRNVNVVLSSVLNTTVFMQL